MRKPDPTEEALHALHRVEDARELAPFLRHKSPAVVGRAAKKAAELEGGDLTAELVDTFRRLMKDPGKLDRGCEALIHIATALAKRDAPVAEVYCAGIRHVQMEGSYGPPVDAAAPLRAVCALGLVRMAYPEALLEATNLLLDPWAAARTGAVRALAESGRPEAELVLRYKARLGDKEPEVTGECFAGLLRLGPRVRALPFVAGFLADANDAVSEAAALALGESHLAEAFPILAEAFSRNGVSQGAILWAMALLRHDEAIEFLFRQLEEGRDRIAAAALQALAVFEADPSIRARATESAARRDSETVRKAWHDHWKK
jgi:HEAT repeat protein